MSRMYCSDDHLALELLRLRTAPPSLHEDDRRCAGAKDLNVGPFIYTTLLSVPTLRQRGKILAGRGWAMAQRLLFRRGADLANTPLPLT